jgi:T-complex protein 1 subunit theta
MDSIGIILFMTICKLFLLQLFHLNSFTALTVATLEDFSNVEQVTKFIRTAIMGKQYGFEDCLAPAVAQACVSILPKNPLNFDVDNVRTVKIAGGGVSDIRVIKGMVVTRDVEGTIRRVKKAKVAVYGGGLDFGKPESKDTWLVTSPDQLEGFQKAQEDQMEKVIKEIADSGTQVVVCNGKIGELAMHFLERYGLMVVKLNSKFDVMRICKVVNAAPVLRLGGPTPDEMGLCDDVHVEEIGSSKVVVFSQETESSRLSTIVLRGATDNILDDVERAVEDGLHTFKAMTKNGGKTFVAGAGAVEIEIASKLTHFGESITGQDQYAYKKFAEAFEVVPRTLAENSGNDATLVVSNLYADHAAGKANSGINVETGEIASALDLAILDHSASKELAIVLATDAAVSVLKIDQILMSRPANGPKPPKMGPVDGPDF